MLNKYGTRAEFVHSKTERSVHSLAMCIDQAPIGQQQHRMTKQARAIAFAGLALGSCRY